MVCVCVIVGSEYVGCVSVCGVSMCVGLCAGCVSVCGVCVSRMCVYFGCVCSVCVG